MIESLTINSRPMDAPSIRWATVRVENSTW
jgi:hypothetical protein